MKLLRTEMRRNPGFWLLPFVATLATYIAFEELPRGIWLWPQTGVAIRDTLLLIGPLTAGLAAWAASRNRRRDMDELLATTSLPAASRDLTAWGATTIWYGFAYSLSAALVMTLAYAGGAWGFPVLWPVLLGLLALVANSALGYAAGYYLPRLFVAPLVAVTLYLAHGVTAFYPASSVRYLSPVAQLDRSPFFGVLPNVFLEQALWLTGVAGMGLAAVALRARFDPRVSWFALATAAAMATIGAALTLTTISQPTPAEERGAIVPYEPVCTKDRLPVCVHPAHREHLSEAASIVNNVSDPLISVPGGPIRAQQGPPLDGVELGRDGTLQFSLYDETSLGEQLTVEIALALGQGPNPRPGRGGPVTEDPTRLVIAGWLLDRAGAEPMMVTGGRPEVANAVNRFAALGPGQRDKWLHQHFAGLGTGETTWKDLP